MRSPLFCLTSLLAKLTFHAFHAFLLKTVFVMAFLVIVPLCNPVGNLWNLIEDATDAETLMYMYTVPIVMLVSGVALRLQSDLT